MSHDPVNTGYKDNGDGTVSITMTIEDFRALLLAIGITIGSDRKGQLAWLALANRMNRGNPNFDQYQIPAEGHE